MAIKRVEADSLSELLKALLPLTSRPCRWLFIETNSNWCAFVENWWRGTDPTANSPLGGDRLSCRSIRCTNIPYRDSPATGNTERSVCAMEDGSNWSFDAFGEPFDFERTDRYQEIRKRDRFTPEMLDDYLRNFGIRAFDESFYHDSNCVAYLVGIDGLALPNMKEYNLADV